ncbi:MAG TPA: protein kinase, partial [Waddliaceae bacterium]
DRNPDRFLGRVPREKLQMLASKKVNVNKTGIILDYADGGTLVELLAKQRSLDLRAVFQISTECAKALQCLHERLQLVHFDLKPENIFLHNNRVKIGDFGFTLPIGEKRSGVGTRGYIAPELIRSEWDKVDYLAHPAADIWALGCTFAELSGRANWYKWCSKMSYTEWSQITDGELDLVKNAFFPNRNDFHFDYIIDNCLQLSPEKRFSAAKIVQICDDYLSL